MAGSADTWDSPAVVTKALDYLVQKKLMTPAEFDALIDQYKAAGFTIAGITDDGMLRVARETLQHAIADQLSTAETADALEQAFTDAGYMALRPWHAELVAQMNTASAYGSGQYQMLRDPRVADAVPAWKYVTMDDDRVRPTHAAMHGRVFAQDDPVWDVWFPPAGFNCFVPGTRVSGAFEAGLKAFYAGPVVEIETARGHAVTVTANHPVLTTQGWIPADAIREGDALVCDAREVDDVATGRVDDQDGPAAIEDVYEALGGEGRSVTRSRPQVSPLELYGDGRFIEGEVDIVWPDGALADSAESASPENAQEAPLARADVDLAFEACLSRAAAAVEGNAASAAGRPGGRALALDGGAVGAQPLPLHALSVGPAPSWDAVATEKRLEGGPAHAAFVRQLLAASAGAVTLDQVTRVRRRPYRGHVYDLQSRTGWILSGGIVTSNCRCHVVGVPAAEWNDRSSEWPTIDQELVQPDEGFAGNPGTYIREQAGARRWWNVEKAHQKALKLPEGYELPADAVRVVALFARAWPRIISGRAA